MQANAASIDAEAASNGALLESQEVQTSNGDGTVVEQVWAFEEATPPADVLAEDFLPEASEGNARVALQVPEPGSIGSEAELHPAEKPEFLNVRGIQVHVRIRTSSPECSQLLYARGSMLCDNGMIQLLLQK